VAPTATVADQRAAAPSEPAFLAFDSAAGTRPLAGVVDGVDRTSPRSLSLGLSRLPYSRNMEP
jgi:hypothetical protein